MLLLNNNPLHIVPPIHTHRIQQQKIGVFWGFYQFAFTDLILPVSQWSNDEPFGAAQKFILVFKAHVCDVDKHLVSFLVKVEATLLQPFKISGTSDI